MTAIAAALALSSTSLLAQAVPDVAPPAPLTPAAPIVESAPTTPILSDPAAIASDPIASSAEPATTTTKSSKSTTIHRTASVARPAKVEPPVARAAPAPAPAAVSVAEPAQTVAAAPVPLAAEPAAQPPAVAAAPPPTPTSSNNMLPIAASVGLMLLALIGLVVVMRRRRLRSEEEVAAAYEVEPGFEGPAPIDPLFAKQAPEPVAARSTAGIAEPALAGPCADAAPGSHVEAACEGPTDDNPSLSIKKRLKRAQFFDQREQLAAAGMAVPVEADAGLPDALVDPSVPITREPA